VIRVGGELTGDRAGLEEELQAAIEGQSPWSSSTSAAWSSSTRPGSPSWSAMGQSNGASRLRFVPSRAQGVIRVLDMMGYERMELAEGVAR